MRVRVYVRKNLHTDFFTVEPDHEDVSFIQDLLEDMTPLGKEQANRILALIERTATDYADLLVRQGKRGAFPMTLTIELNAAVITDGEGSKNVC